MQILVLQIKRIGDAILTAPALGALRTRLPDAHLTLVLQGAAAGLAPAYAMVDEVLTYAPGAAARQCWRKVLLAKYDAVIDFTGTDRSALMALATRAAIRIAYTKDTKNWLRRRAYTHLCDASVRDLHTIDLHHALVERLVQALQMPLSARPADGGHLQLPTDLALPALPCPYAVVHPGTAREEKYWPAENWMEVIRHLREQHQLPIVLTGSDDAYEMKHLAAIESLTGVHANLSGQLNLLQLAAVIQNSRIVLGVDSAAMHLAAAFQRPQLALFGPTNPYHWRARHAQSMVLTAGEDDTALPRPRHEKAPMSELSPERVCKAVDSLLSSAASPSPLASHSGLES